MIEGKLVERKLVVDSKLAAKGKLAKGKLVVDSNLFVERKLHIVVIQCFEYKIGELAFEGKMEQNLMMMMKHYY